MTLPNRLVLVVAASFLCGCDHHRASSDSTPPAARGDSELTGIPAQPLSSTHRTPPRATLVALPPGYATNTTTSTTTVTAPASPPSTPAPLVAETAPPPTPRDAPASAPPVTPPPETAAEAVSPMPMPDPTPGDAIPSTAAPDPTPAATAAPGVTNALVDAPAPSKDQIVVLDTSFGRIVIALDDFAAPRTCKNFRQLVQDGFYNQTVFHRVIPNFIIQGGDPQSKSAATNRDIYGLGGPGYTLPSEIELKHDRGAVAMARLPDSVNPSRSSNGSQFYICLVAAPTLDDQYTVFGHVLRGMDVADKIAEAPRDKRDNPLSRVEMTVSLQPKIQVVGPGTTASP